MSAAANASITGIDRALEIVVDGGGASLQTGLLGLNIEVPYNCTIVGNRVYGNAAGSIVFDIWKDTYANYPPTVADTICAAAKPTLSAVAKSQDLTLTGWTTTLSQGDILRVNIDSVSGLTSATLTLLLHRV